MNAPVFLYSYTALVVARFTKVSYCFKMLNKAATNPACIGKPELAVLRHRSFFERVTAPRIIELYLSWLSALPSIAVSGLACRVCQGISDLVQFCR